jgi:hypothetical protein
MREIILRGADVWAAAIVTSPAVHASTKKGDSPHFLKRGDGLFF